jgi:TolA-binding protein
MTHLVQSSLETFKQKETFERAESRRVEETKVSNSLRQRCSNLEHKVQELERRNARLERKASEMEMENRKISQTAESYRIHYEGLRGKASMSPSLGGGSSTGGGGNGTLELRNSTSGMMLAPPPRSSHSRSSSTSSHDALRMTNFQGRGSKSNTPSPRRSPFLHHQNPGRHMNDITNRIQSPSTMQSSMGRSLFSNGRSMASSFMRHGPSIM